MTAPLFVNGGDTQMIVSPDKLRAIALAMVSHGVALWQSPPAPPETYQVSAFAEDPTAKIQTIAITIFNICILHRKSDWKMPQTPCQCASASGDAARRAADRRDAAVSFIYMNGPQRTFVK